MNKPSSLIKLDSLEELYTAHENYRYVKLSYSKMINKLCDKWVELEYPKKNFFFKLRTRNKTNYEKLLAEVGRDRVEWTLDSVSTQAQDEILYNFKGWYEHACEANQIIKSGNHDVYATSYLLLFINEWKDFDRSVMEVE